MDKKQIEELIKRVKDQEDSRMVHVPYAEASGRMPDFEVEYEIIGSSEENTNFTQGARCDFLYEGDDPAVDGIHMIWPEFLDDQGNVILDKKIRPRLKGKATMWILDDNSRRNIHQKRLTVGTSGYWVAGTSKIAKVNVTKIIGLFEDYSEA